MRSRLMPLLAALALGAAALGGGAPRAAHAASPSKDAAASGTKAAAHGKARKGAKAAPAARSQAAASAPTATERLQALVPARIGRWKRVAAPEPGAAGDDPAVPGLHADYVAGRLHLAVAVAKSPAALPAPSGLPSLVRTEAGHELVYREGREIVVERLRRADEHAQVTLRRDDGLTIVVEGTGIEPARLKAVARLVARRG